MFLYNSEHKCYSTTNAEVINRLPAGRYLLKYDAEGDLNFYESIKLIYDSTNFLPDYTDIINGIDNFAKIKNKYNLYKIPYKLSYIIHGDSGTGKNHILSAVSDYIIDKLEGIVIDLKYLDINLIRKLIELHSIQPDRIVLITISKLDEFIQMIERDNVFDQFINLLNCKYNFNNFICMMRVNKLESISESMVNNKLLIDHIIETKLPSSDIRRIFLLDTIHMDDIDKWVNDTAGFSMYNLQELLIMVHIKLISYNDAIKMIKFNSKKRIGFK